MMSQRPSSKGFPNDLLAGVVQVHFLAAAASDKGGLNFSNIKPTNKCVAAHMTNRPRPSEQGSHSRWTNETSE
jgi:hypothetical protein